MGVQCSERYLLFFILLHVVTFFLRISVLGQIVSGVVNVCIRLLHHIRLRCSVIRAAVEMRYDYRILSQLNMYV